MLVVRMKKEIVRCERCFVEIEAEENEDYCSNEVGLAAITRNVLRVFSINPGENDEPFSSI